MKILDTFTVDYKNYLEENMSEVEKKRVVRKITKYLYKKIRFFTVVFVLISIILGIFVFEDFLRIIFLIMLPILFIFLCHLVIHDGDYFQLDDSFKLAFSVDKLNQINKNKYLFGTNVHPKYLVGNFSDTHTICLNKNRRIYFNENEFILNDGKNYSKIFLNKNVKKIYILTKEDILTVDSKKEKKQYTGNVVISILLKNFNRINIILKNNPNVGIKEIENIANKIIKEFKSYIK